MVRIGLPGLVVVSAAKLASCQCQNLTIPISISSQNSKFNLTAPSSNIEVTNFILNLAQQGNNFTEDIATGYATVSGNYSIAAQYCTPDAGPGTALQVLTHGVGFDRSYWDFPIHDHNYSYVAQALERGYSTFAYDRLGIGQSSHGEPVNEIQSTLEVAALRALTTGLRSATLPGITDSYAKVFHVGHSFGSIQTYGLTAEVAAEGKGETISDGIALTGFSAASQFVPYFLFGGQFVSAPTLPAGAGASYANGYLAAGSNSSVQTNFFAPGMFDPEVLAAAARTGQPVTVGELLTLAAPASKPNGYSGPVLVVTGAISRQPSSLMRGTA
ncbi:hypothetical protein SLS62_006211 [Diatrype stigma]|uniref:AB hydrolase-1 domain-containing protein n=1 Tax=Diatrype stigma TaxID=117547 RepID=A0AAN9YS66_9PEZI